MNVVGYLRVSTEGQTKEDTYGLDSQKAIVEKYCEEHDMTIADWYIDRAVSGVKENRPALNELLFGDVKNPPVEAVVIAKSDRMSRDMKLYYYYLFLLEKKGMKLISATEEVVNDDTGLGNVYKALMLFVAEQERKNITMRMSGGRAVKAKNGGYAGGRPPYGYKTYNGRLRIDDDEAVIVRRVFELRGQGASYRDIIKKLTEEELKTRKGTAWKLSNIQSIINNENFYRGMYKYGNDEWIQGQQEPILISK